MNRSELEHTAYHIIPLPNDSINDGMLEYAKSII
jgi:hypothetical protein